MRRVLIASLPLCLLLAGKSARVTSYWAGEFPEALARDAVPNLLLIELTLTRLQRAHSHHEAPNWLAPQSPAELTG